MSSEYRSVKIPKKLADQIDKHLVGKFGYSSRAEVCKDGVRMILRERMSQENPKKEV